MRNSAIQATIQASKGAAEKCNEDIRDLVKSRHALLWISSNEESRVERAIAETLPSYEVSSWDVAGGEVRSGKSTPNGRESINRPDVYLSQIEAACTGDKSRQGKKAVFVLRDFHKQLDSMTARMLKNLAMTLQASSASLVVIAPPGSEIPAELTALTTAIEYPIPDRAEIASILDRAIARLSDEMRATLNLDDAAREKAVDAAVGLTAEEAFNCYTRSLVTTRGQIDSSLVAGEKKRIIARAKVLTWTDPDPRGLDAIGGLDVAKTWLRERKAAFSKEARAYGLKAPKGVLLVGIPGTGKSLFAKAAATALGCVLLRLDLGGLKSKFVGDSEANIRAALRMAETVSPCVLWIDEIEKGLAGSTGTQGDGGTGADQLGTILSWFQDCTAPVFVVATANNVETLPPELLRKGRFDEIFFTSLPTRAERREILSTALLAAKRDPKDFDVTAIAAKCETFTGAEIASIVPAALFRSFADGARPLETADLLDVAAVTVPLATTAAEKIKALLDWAKNRARNASAPETEENTTATLDI